MPNMNELVIIADLRGDEGADFINEMDPSSSAQLHWMCAEYDYRHEGNEYELAESATPGGYLDREVGEYLVRVNWRLGHVLVIA